MFYPFTVAMQEIAVLRSIPIALGMGGLLLRYPIVAAGL